MLLKTSEDKFLRIPPNSKAMKVSVVLGAVGTYS